MFEVHETDSPSLKSKKEAYFFYNNATSLIAHSEFQGGRSEIVFKTLAFLQKVKTDLAADITAQAKAEAPVAPPAEEKSFKDLVGQ
jgi:hypothetical protein